MSLASVYIGLGESNCGAVDAANYRAIAETKLGISTQAASDFAGRLNAYVVVSFIEKDGDQYFHTASLVDPSGKLVGQYRQTHLDENLSAVLNAGDALPVFDTTIGQIGRAHV